MSRLYLADKETLDAIKADTTGILKELQDTDGKFSGIKRYGIKINKADSNPDTRVTYLYDAVGLEPAKMNYAQDTFDYGGWGDVFFVKENRPVMLNADRTVAYELCHTDFSKKIDGETASDVTDESTALNAMSEFPQIWLCQYEVGNYEYVIVSNTQIDSSYHADAYTREDGTIANHMYLPLYGGSYDGAKLRSLSGKKLDCNTNAQTEINRAAANGTGWTVIPWCRRNLIECLLMIVSKSENFQAKFGQGVCNTYVEDAAQDYGKVKTGTLDAKGQFYGANDGKHEVKVFYMEKMWGNRWDRIAGYICDKGTIKVKMTPPYNLTGKDYITIGAACETNGYQKDTLTTRYGRFVKTVGGGSTTYRCAYYYINLTIVAIALVGGRANDGASCGAFVNLSYGAGFANWSIGASPSCEEPLSVA